MERLWVKGVAWYDWKEEKKGRLKEMSFGRLKRGLGEDWGKSELASVLNFVSKTLET